MPIRTRIALGLFFVIAGLVSAVAEDARITIDASREMNRVSRFLTGACIEDVNHEIYGGIYSQMIFGESFQEPPVAVPIEGFTAFGGTWALKDGAVWSGTGEGTKLVAGGEPLGDGEISVDLWFENKDAGNSGFLARVGKPVVGADNFDGYEISLEPGRQLAVLGRHVHNWALLKEEPVNVPLKEWVNLKARLKGSQIEVLVNDRLVIRYEDQDKSLSKAGAVALRQWQRSAGYRNLAVDRGTGPVKMPFVQNQKARNVAVSGMWRPIQTGDVQARFQLDREKPFVGSQGQLIAFEKGNGEAGIYNKGLNGWGLYFQEGRPYEGLVYARTEKACKVWAVLENEDGSTVLAEQKLSVEAGDWQRIEFNLTPKKTVGKGRFTLRLKEPGEATFGYVMLQPGAWGRFKNLPVRRDVAEGLQKQGVTMLRYGGSMVNNPNYRWKKMIGPRAQRPPYDGHWYDYSTNGWGIVDFLGFCETAGFEAVPTFHFGESPEDLADFVKYATAGVETEWGRKRAADGHPDPYPLKYMQLGNEERVDLAYAAKFQKMAEAIWAVKPEITLVVGDFVYDHLIRDSSKLTGAASGITNLDGQRAILEFAKSKGHEVWFDLHVWTAGPRPNSSFDAMFTFIDALEKMQTGAKFKVVVFEFNSNNHDQRRAIGNALAINAIERDGRVPVALSANCLQPDGQNDNGWNQGLLFLSPSRVWLQPPGFVTQMYAREYRPRLVACGVDGSKAIDCNAKLSADGRSMVMNVVNTSDKAVSAVVRLDGFTPKRNEATVQTLSGPLDAANGEFSPSRIVPKASAWKFGELKSGAKYQFEPWSVTTIVIE